MMVAMMLVTMLGLTTTALTVSTTAVSAATDKWSRMDLPTTLNYQMFPDSMIWDLTAADDGTLFALVEDTTGADGGCIVGGAYDANYSVGHDTTTWQWDGKRWAVYPAYSDIAVFKSTDGGYSWSLMWHVPSSETGAPIAIVPQPGYADGDSANDAVFFAMGTRYISGNNSSVGGNMKWAGNLSEGNIYRSMNAGALFTRVNPRCPAVTINKHGEHTGGTITSMDVVENMGFPGTYMAIVGVSSLNTSDGTADGNRGEGVYAWNRNNTAFWDDLQLSDAAVTVPEPGTEPAGNGLDVIQVIGSPNYTTDGLIAAVANDIVDSDPAVATKGIYVCFYDANDGIWGGDIDSPTTATRLSTTTEVNWTEAVGHAYGHDYAGAASMAIGTDFNNVTSAYVFVGLDGCKTNKNNDLWRVRGLATVTGPSTVSTMNVYPLLTSQTGTKVTGGRISDVMVPAEANTAVYVGCEFPAGQAQELVVSSALVWASPVPSFKPTSGGWPVSITNMAGTIMAASGFGDYHDRGIVTDTATTGGVHKMVQTARGTAFNGVGLLDDIAVSENIPGFNGSYTGMTGSTWCLAEAVAEEVSPTYATDGLIYVTTSSDWKNGDSEAGLSLWRLTNGKWERIMYYGIELPDGSIFDDKNISTNVGQYAFVRGETWWPRVVPQFSTDQSMFLLGARDNWISDKDQEMIWYSPDKGNDWKALPQMPIGAAGWQAGGSLSSTLSESGWWAQDSNTLFVGDMNGFIYKTANRGASWTDGALTGTGLEISNIRTSPIYAETGAAGTDKCLIVGTYDQNSHESEVWISQDGAITKDLENIGDEIYVSPSWTAPDGDTIEDLGGTVVNFDKNWATNKVVYAASQGWLDQWQLVGAGAGGTEDLNRIAYTDVSVVRTVVDINDPSASTWETLWNADDWNNAAPKPQAPYVVPQSDGQTLPDYRLVIPSAIEVGPDGTVYVTFSLADSSYNTPPDNPTPQRTQVAGDVYIGGRFTLSGTLRCLDGTLKTTEWEIMHDGLGPWDGLWLNRVVAGTNHAISLTWDWKEWRFKLAFWEDTLSGVGPAPVSPLANAQGVGALVADTSVNAPLSWQAKGGASQYDWQVSEDSAFTPANTKSGTTSDLTVTVQDLKPATTYFWRSRAVEPMLGRWNTAQQFTTVIGGETGAAKLITPEIGATISDATPLFTWSGVASASNYQIQVATSPTFGSADIVIDKTLGNVQAYEADKELVNGTYYWQVKGTNATTDTETPWSALGSFTLDTEAGGQGTPVWVWVLIVLGVLLGIVVLVLILRTRRPV